MEALFKNNTNKKTYKHFDFKLVPIVFQSTTRRVRVGSDLSGSLCVEFTYCEGVPEITRRSKTCTLGFLETLNNEHFKPNTFFGHLMFSAL